MKIQRTSGFHLRKPATQAVIQVLADIAESRSKEREDMVKARLQLDKLRLEFQRRILASRAKFHAARWKIIHKSMDD
ncbi:MAG: hypothetical protein J0I12_31245 [Candidatus Eremiobacteraeota bacterium]|nr:hypothetical protein [Candidatus Eremiobacteraeota bacterium]